MNLKKMMLACIAGLTSFGVMAAPLALDTTNTFVGTAGTLLKNSASDVSGWQYNGVDLISDMDDASTIKSTTALDLNTSGGELKQTFGAPLVIPTSGAYEYSVDTTFQFTKDWPTDLLASLQTSGAKTAVFAMANNADDDSLGAKIVVAHGGAWYDEGGSASPAAGFAVLCDANGNPLTISTNVSYTVTVRVKGFTDNAVSQDIFAPATLIKVLVNGQEYMVKAYDGTTIGSQIGFDGTENLDAIGTGAGNWLASVSFTKQYFDTKPSGDDISSVSFQGTGTLDNMALATYTDPILASWTLDVVGTGVVNDSNSQPVSGVLGAGTYTVVPGEGFILGSIVSTTETGFSVTGNEFTLDAATGLDTVTVTFKAVTAEAVAADIANIPEGQLDATAKGKLNAAIGGVTDGASKFDAWADAKGVAVADLTTSGVDNVINAFLCNVALNETTGLLAITEVTAAGTTFTAKVFVGAISVGQAEGKNVLLVNGSPVAYVGTALGSLAAAGSNDVSISEKDQDDYVTITVTMPQGTSGFVKFAIE